MVYAIEAAVPPYALRLVDPLGDVIRMGSATRTRVVLPAAESTLIAIPCYQQTHGDPGPMRGWRREA